RLRPPLLGVGLGARGVEIGHADELDVGRELLDRGDVELADITCADHAGAKSCVAHRVSLWAISSRMRITSATRADQVSFAIALDRPRRASGSSSAIASSSSPTNASGVPAPRHRWA